ncbi:MAG: glycosyltransferase, partial [Planctomycetes bacterium]|nr:glycosyltransferase [Planctomycetota bacterium]
MISDRPAPAPRDPPARVALVHDWLTGMRGGERCLETFAALLPSAPILTLIHERGSVSPAIERHPIVASPLSRWRFARRHYRRLLPLFPWAVERLPGRDYDLIVSLSHCAAKAVPMARAARHVCYCFTPARYLWDQREEYLSRERSSPFARAAARACFPYLRRWDRRSARRVDRFVAISRFVAERIRNCYGRDAEVIHPPVDAARFRTASPAELGDYYLMV